MTTTRESQVYLNFIKTYLPLIALATLFSTGGVVYYRLHQPFKYTADSLLEIEHTETNGSQKVALADQAVSLLRASQLSDQFGIKSVDSKIFKPGPLSIAIELTGTDKDQLSESIGKMESYLQSKYSVKKIGITSYSQADPHLALFILLGVSLGVSIGLIFSLIHFYFRNY